MAKISTYTQVVTPTTDDIVIGTDISDSNATKNFTLGDIIALVDTPTLDYVLTQGNTSAQNITLTGSALLTTPNATVSGSLLSSNVLAVSGALKDGASSAGTSGQVLTSTGTGVSWASLGFAMNLVLDAASASATQNPAGTSVALQVNFGAAQGTVSDPVMIDASGTVTFNETGLYLVNAFGNVYRTSTSGNAHLMFRGLVNGVQSGYVKTIFIEKANFLMPYELTIPVYISVAGTTFEFEIMRDASGDNDGGLRSFTGTSGWTTTPSAYIQIWKQEPA